MIGRVSHRDQWRRTCAVQTSGDITDAGRQNFPDSTFTVPAGYQKRDMMGGRGRGRGQQ